MGDDCKRPLQMAWGTTYHGVLLITLYWLHVAAWSGAICMVVAAVVPDGGLSDPSRVCSVVPGSSWSRVVARRAIILPQQYIFYLFIVTQD
jgi:hypothetical protein